MQRRHLLVEVGLFLSLYLNLLHFTRWRRLDPKEKIRRKTEILLRRGKQPEHYAYSTLQLTELKNWFVNKLSDERCQIGIEQPRDSYYHITLEGQDARTRPGRHATYPRAATKPTVRRRMSPSTRQSKAVSTLRSRG
jgi:hypothetical protein